MGICISGVTLKKLDFDCSESPETKLSVPYVTHKSFKRSLKNNEIIFYTDYIEISEDSLSMSYSSLNDFKHHLCFKLYKISLSDLFDKIEGDSLIKKYKCPFYHFLNFSDCDGFIGPSAVKDMAKALQDKKFKAKFLKNSNSKNSNFYREWTETFYKIIMETAKADGYLRFS